MSYGGCRGRHRYRHHHRGRPFRRHGASYQRHYFSLANLQQIYNFPSIFFTEIHTKITFTHFLPFRNNFLSLRPAYESPARHPPSRFRHPPATPMRPSPQPPHTQRLTPPQPSTPQKAAFQAVKGSLSPRKRPPSGKQKAAFRNNPGSHTCRPGLDPSSS